MAKRLATLEDLQAFDPNVATATAGAYLAATAHLFNLDWWQEKASDGHALWTLHIMASSGSASGGAGAQVSRREFGPMRTYYNVSNQATGPSANTTHWGVLYQSLFDSLPPPIIAV